MSDCSLLIIPTASGKTAHVLNLVRDAARDLQSTPRICLPTHLQVRSWRRRLAQAGGAIGVRLLTFDRLYAECLNAAGEVYTELSELVQYRLIRAVGSRLGEANTLRAISIRSANRPRTPHHTMPFCRYSNDNLHCHHYMNSTGISGEIWSKGAGSSPQRCNRLR